MFVARLLSPAEIGVYSVTMVLLGFVATFRDMGAGQYLVQQKSLTEERIRATWSVQLGLGLILGLVVLIAALPMAAFYNEPRMREIMSVLAFNFAITPFLAFPYAWLSRDMRFGTIATVRFIGSLAHAGCAIGLAWMGQGPISLAWANLLTTVAGIFAICLLSPPRWPWRPTLTGISEVVSFGGKLTLTSLLNTFAGGAPELILGKIQSMLEAGLYSRALGLVTMFHRLVLDAVNAVALPYFSKQSREAKDMGTSFLLAMELITGLGWAFFTGVGILAFQAIWILYGDQWGESVEPARWLALSYAISIPAGVCYSPLIAHGASTQVLKVTSSCTVVVLVATVLGASANLVTLSQLLAVASLVSTFLWLRLTRGFIPFTSAALGKVWYKSLMLAVGAGTVPMLVVLAKGVRSPDIFQTVVISVIGGILGFLVAAWLVKHQVWAELVKLLKAKKTWTNK